MPNREPTHSGADESVALTKPLFVPRPRCLPGQVRPLVAKSLGNLSPDLRETTQRGRHQVVGGSGN